MNLTVKDVAAMVDHTNLKAFATREDFQLLCDEAENAVKDGCQEFDYVCNVGKVKEHDYAYIKEEMTRMVAVARKAGIC